MRIFVLREPAKQRKKQIFLCGENAQNSAKRKNFALRKNAQNGAKQRKVWNFRRAQNSAKCAKFQIRSAKQRKIGRFRTRKNSAKQSKKKAKAHPCLLPSSHLVNQNRSRVWRTQSKDLIWTVQYISLLGCEFVLPVAVIYQIRRVFIACLTYHLNLLIINSCCFYCNP